MSTRTLEPDNPPLAGFNDSAARGAQDGRSPCKITAASPSDRRLTPYTGRHWERAPRTRMILPGPTAVVLGALLWGTNGLAVSFLPSGTSTLTVAAARLLAGGGLLLLLCRPRHLPRLLTDRAAAFAMAVAAAAMASYQSSYFAALRLTGVTIGTVVTMTSVPVFAGVTACAIGRTRVCGRWAAATALAVAGSVVLSLSRPDGRPVAAGIVCALVAGASYAIFTAASATVINRGVDSRTAMTAALLAAGIALTPVLVVCPTGWIRTVPGVTVLGYLAGVTTVLAYLLYGHGLRTTPTTAASTLILSEPACAAVIGVLVLHEPITARGAAGLLLITAALVILTRTSTGTGARGPVGRSALRHGWRPVILDGAHADERAPQTVRPG